MLETTALAQTNSKAKNYPKAYVFGLLISVVLFALSVALTYRHELKGLQLNVFRDLNNLTNVFKLPALWITEGLGAAYPIAVCVILPALFKRFRLAWRFFVTVGGAGVVMEIAKLIAKEPRPAAMLHGQLHLRAQESGLTGFPSGHEAVATAMALTLWMILPRRWRWLSVVWIIIVGVSRIYLGVHTPNDIIGGFAIGLMAVCVVRLLPTSLAKPLHLGSERPLLEKGF